MSPKHIHLSAYSEKDRAALTALLIDPEVMEHVDGPKSPEAIDWLFNRFLGLAPTQDDIWAIRHAQTDDYVGHAALFVSGVCSANEREILFYLHKKYWGKDIAFEAASKMLEHARERKFEKIWATVDSDHFPSIRICERLGMVLDRREEDADGEFLVYRFDVAEA